MNGPETAKVNYVLMPKPRGPNKPHFVDDADAAKKTEEQLRAIGHAAWLEPSSPEPRKSWSGRLKLAALIGCSVATWAAIAGLAYLLARLAT